MIALRAAGYRTRNYVGSWHEWSRRGPAGRALGGDCDPRGGFDEVPAEGPPELRPLGGVPVVLGEELVSRPGHLVRSFGQPGLEGRPVDLGMELDGPHRVAEPERLGAALAPREHRAPVGAVSS